MCTIPGGSIHNLKSTLWVQQSILSILIQTANLSNDVASDWMESRLASIQAEMQGVHLDDTVLISCYSQTHKGALQPQTPQHTASARTSEIA